MIKKIIFTCEDYYCNMRNRKAKLNRSAANYLKREQFMHEWNNLGGKKTLSRKFKNFHVRSRRIKSNGEGE